MFSLSKFWSLFGNSSSLHCLSLTWNLLWNLINHAMLFLFDPSLVGMGPLWWWFFSITFYWLAQMHCTLLSCHTEIFISHAAIVLILRMAFTLDLLFCLTARMHSIDGPRSMVWGSICTNWSNHTIQKTVIDWYFWF